MCRKAWLNLGAVSLHCEEKELPPAFAGCYWKRVDITAALWPGAPHHKVWWMVEEKTNDQVLWNKEEGLWRFKAKGELIGSPAK